MPYILWNILCWAWVAGSAGLKGNAADLAQLLKPALWLDALAFTPYDKPLWFVRDLMVLSLAAPLLGRVLSLRGGAVLLLAAGGAWFTLCPMPPVLLGGWMSLFFYSLRAWCALRGVEFARLVSAPGFWWLPWAAGAAMFGSIAAEDTTLHCLYRPLERLEALLWGATAVRLASRHLESGAAKWCQSLAAASFFVYAAHFPLCGSLSRLLYRSFIALPPAEFAAAVFPLKLLATVTVCALCLAAFRLLQRLTPCLCAILAGRR